MLENNLNTYTLQKIVNASMKIPYIQRKLIPRSCCFVINRENIRVRAHTYGRRLKLYFPSQNLRYLSWLQKSFLFTIFVLSDEIWEQIHIKHLINNYNRIFILISHYYTKVFESNSEKQSFSFTTRRGSRILCKGDKIGPGVQGP